MIVTDTLVGVGGAVPGSAVQGSNVGPLTWGTTFTGLYRGTGGGTVADDTQGSARLEIPYGVAGIVAPELIVVEGEFNISGSGFYIAAEISVSGDGYSTSIGGGGTRAGCIVNNYGSYAEYRVYTGQFGPVTVHGDGVYGGYVKRRMEVDTVAATYKCFANDVLIASGSYTSYLTPNPGAATGLTVAVYADRRSSSGGNVANLRNMYVGTEAKVLPTNFWTGFDNAHENL